MTWASIDDNMQNHPKVVAAGAIAELIQYRAIQYCCRYLTDGVIPRAAVETLVTGLEHISIATGGVPGMFEVGQDCSEINWPEQMVAAGLWHRRRGGYVVHDFLIYNPSRLDVLAKREKKRLAGIKGAYVTNSKASTSAHDAAPASALTQEGARPPTPTPTPKEKASAAQGVRPDNGPTPATPEHLRPARPPGWKEPAAGAHTEPIREILERVKPHAPADD